MTTTPQAQSAMQAEPTPAVVAAARVLCKRSAAICNVDEADSWKVYGDDYLEDAALALAAAAPETAAERDRLRAERDVALIALSNLVHRYKFDGIPNDSLPFVAVAQDVIDSMEAGAGAAHLQSEADRLRALNAELVEALRKIEEGDFEGAADMGIRSEWHEFVNSLQAIAKAARATGA